jgi:hypothetical protein
MDNELDPITNTEFSGPVGHEKKIHKTHWTLHPKKNQQVAQGAEVK